MTDQNIETFPQAAATRHKPTPTKGWPSRRWAGPGAQLGRDCGRRPWRGRDGRRTVLTGVGMNTPATKETMAEDNTAKEIPDVDAKRTAETF